DARQVDDRVLLGDLDALAHAGRVTVDDRGEDADGQVEAGTGVADPRLDAGGWAVACAGEAHDASHGLRHHLAAVVRGVRPFDAEALDGGGDDAGGDAREILKADADAVHRA